MTQSELQFAALSITMLPARGVRVVVPFTPTVRAFRRRVIFTKWANIVFMTAVFITASIAAWPAPTAWFCFGPCALLMLIAAYWATTHPRLIAPFRADDATIQVTDHRLTLTFANAHDPIEVPTKEIHRIKAKRCNFSRCWKIVVLGRRKSGPFHWTLAVHNNSTQLANVARVLRDAVGLAHQ
jgi:hypothetical protein